MRLAATVTVWSAVAIVGCRSSNSTSSPPPEPVPEIEPYRPLYHFTTPTNWINDPNGPVFFEGEYHLFYQYNPSGDQWGNISWGHAVSDDQVRWRHLPVAIPAEGDTLIFSGSAVADSENTSGLCADPGREPTGGPTSAEGCLVAIHTAFVVDPVTLIADQVQNLAVSEDRGLTFEPYAGNPVLDEPEPDFRDPNVFWHAPSEQWVMTVALAVERRIALYGSPNLREWTPLSEFGPIGAVGGIWECPVLLELPVEGTAGEERRWLLKIDLNPGHVAGGSGAQYFVGDFDGREFVPGEVEPSILWVDRGRDFYCALQWTNEPAPGGERTWIAWMSDWTYAADTPTSPWRGAMTIPRALSLRRTPGGLRVVQRPIDALEALRGARLQVAGDDLTALTEELRNSGILGRANELRVSIEPGSANEVGLQLRRAEDQELVIGAFFDVGSDEARVFVDRTRAGEIGFNEAFAGRHEAPVRLADGRLELQVYLDSSSVEVFAADGEVVLTDLIFPAPDAVDGAIYAAGGSVGRVELDVWELLPALPEGTIDPGSDPGDADRSSTERAGSRGEPPGSQ